MPWIPRDIRFNFRFSMGILQRTIRCDYCLFEEISSMLFKKHKVTMLQRSGVRLNVVSDIRCMNADSFFLIK